MRAYYGIGEFISRHIQVICPACMILSVLFPQVLLPVRPYVGILLALLTFQGSLGNTFANLARAFRHPAPMLAVLLVTSVVLPLVLWPVANLLFGFDQAILTGLALQPCVPLGISCVMWVSLFDGDVSLALATLLVGTLVSPVTIPLMMQVLLGATVRVDVLGMMRDMALMVALPAFLGTLLNERTHGWAKEQLNPRVTPASRIVFLLIISANASGVARYVWELDPVLLAVVGYVFAFTFGGFVVGFALARLMRQPLDRLVSMVFLCGVRNISAGAVLASMYFPGLAVFPVVCGTLVQQTTAGIVGTWVRGYVGRHRAAEAAVTDAPEAGCTSGGETDGESESETVAR